MPRTTTRPRAEAHEALYPRLVAVLAQLAPVAARRPDAPVPPATRIIAEALLYDAKPFTRGGGFPAAAGTVAALATELGNLRAVLEGWEAEHSHWSGDCYVWRLTRGEDPLPIQRLRARSKQTIVDPRAERETQHMREALIRRFDARYEEGYENGYADANAGRERQPPDTLAARIAQLNQD